jgi:endonuclease G
MIKPEFALSYNQSAGGPNWSLASGSKRPGRREERGAFAPDRSLPERGGSCRTITTEAVTTAGIFVRRGDRTANRAGTTRTFVMSNMLPQEGDINRSLGRARNLFARFGQARRAEAYIIAGGYGSKEKIAPRKSKRSDNFWKIIVVLPKGEN